MALSTAALLLSTVTHAGGDYGEIAIYSLEIDTINTDQYQFSAKVLTEAKKLNDWKNCNEIIVIGSFDSQRWRNYDRPMSEVTHAKGIEELAQSLKDSIPIYFGLMGADLKELDDCVFGPYSTNDLAHSLSGLTIDVENRSSIDTHDNIVLIATSERNENVGLYEFDRSTLLNSCSDKCYSRDKANISGSCN